jgi:hypothetical protein
MNLQDSNPSDLLGAAWELIVPIFKEITLKSSEGRTGASVRLRFAAVVQKLPASNHDKSRRLLDQSK